jgi:hypothetical protein
MIALSGKHEAPMPGQLVQVFQDAHRLSRQRRQMRVTMFLAVFLSLHPCRRDRPQALLKIQTMRLRATRRVVGTK